MRSHGPEKGSAEECADRDFKSQCLKPKLESRPRFLLKKESGESHRSQKDEKPSEVETGVELRDCSTHASDQPKACVAT